jgi:hypothetical protein
MNRPSRTANSCGKPPFAELRRRAAQRTFRTFVLAAATAAPGPQRFSFADAANEGT